MHWRSSATISSARHVCAQAYASSIAWMTVRIDVPAHVGMCSDHFLCLHEVSFGPMDRRYRLRFRAASVCACKIQPADHRALLPMTAEPWPVRHTGEEGGPAAAIRVLDDAMELPQQDHARLRVVHAAADAGRVDVNLPGRQDPLAGGLEFQDASEFTELAAAPAPLELRPTQRTETMLRVPDLRLAGGGLYTVVVIGRTRTEPPLETLVIEDRSAGGLRR
jgi:hypothetical protein